MEQKDRKLMELQGNYLTTKDAADYLGIRHGTVRMLLSTGKIPFVKQWGRTLIRTKDLDEYRKNKSNRGRPSYKN